MLALALAVRSMTRTTDDYVAAGRRIGLGFGSLGDRGVDVVGGRADFGVIAYTWGIRAASGSRAKGLAIMLLAPFALHLRKKLPAGYTSHAIHQGALQQSRGYRGGAGGHRLYCRDVILLDALGAVIVLILFTAFSR